MTRLNSPKSDAQRSGLLVRTLATGSVIGALTLLAGCPSEPSNNMDDGISPGAVSVEEGETVLDEVEVMSPEEAMNEATEAIDEDNVLDALEELEKEIGSDN